MMLLRTLSRVPKVDSRFARFFLAGLQFDSTEVRVEAEQWSRTHEDFIVSGEREVGREEAAPLVAAACCRENANWLLQR